MDIDSLIVKAVLSAQGEEKEQAQKEIQRQARENGVYCASIHELYMAIGRGDVGGFTVPAMNIRGLTYDTARIIFRLATQNHIGPFIFEIAKSEQKYTNQPPQEYSSVILAAALREGYRGPVFLQGDHYQFNRKLFLSDPETEIRNIKNLIKNSIEAGFFNIDIDASTLVDLEKKEIDDQQKNNYEMTALMTEYVRSIEPKDITVSVGGEIGHIGGKNSTVEDFHAFMKGYERNLKSQMSNVKSDKEMEYKGISKVSVQTGTSHGGIPLADGALAKVSLDFEVLNDVGRVAREEYHIGGAVQHGASTLPDEFFNKFPEVKTLEIHLATGFQNTVYTHLPTHLKQNIYEWLTNNCKADRKPDWNDEQFFYKTRKKGFGPFKKEMWKMSEAEKQPILEALEKQLLFLFTQLHVLNTNKKIQSYV